MPPRPGALAELEARGPFDWVAGYSLGAFLLLSDPAATERIAPSVALLAPIFSFAQEDGLGGRVHRAQLRMMIRRLRADPAAALADFHARAGLDIPPGDSSADTLPKICSGACSAWSGTGIRRRCRPDGRLGAGRRMRCWMPASLRELAPGIEVVPGATHHPLALLQTLRKMSAAGAGARKSSFDRAARTYLAHAQVQTAMAEWLAEWLPAERAGRALELGAGPGVFTRLLLPWSGKLVASDSSESMCAAGQAEVPGVAWAVMSAEAPEPGPWHWMFSSSMLQWIADPAAVFAGWRARAGRRRTHTGRTLRRGQPAGMGRPRRRRGALGLAPSRGSGAATCKAAGFCLVREESVVRTFIHPSARDFLRSVHRVGAAPERRMPPGQLRRLLCDYEARHRRGGGVVATWVFHRFEARLA